MKIVESLKVKIYPKINHIEYFRKAFGIRRWLWNWGIDMCTKRFENERKLYGAYDLSKIINSYVKLDKLKWVKAVNSMVMQEVFRDLEIAYTTGISEIKKSNKKYNTYMPRYRTRKDQTNSFKIHNKSKEYPSIRFDKNIITLATTKDIGRFNIKCSENLNKLKNFRICNITILEESNDCFYAIIVYERTNHIDRIQTKNVIGIDCGIKTPLVSVDNKGRVSEVKIPKSKFKHEKRTDNIKSKLDRKVYNSRGYVKMLKKLQKSHRKEDNIMKNYRNHIIKYYIDTYDTIKIEPYNFQIFKSRYANRSEHRFGMFDFIKCLKQKAYVNKVELIIIPDGTPTTQTCSKCGAVKSDNEKLSLKDRVYKCTECDNILDRDINAAINILNY